MSDQRPYEEHPYITELRQEAVQLSGQERIEHEKLVAQLIAEMEQSQRMQEMAMMAVNHAKRLSMEASAARKEKPRRKHTATVELDRIGWIEGEAEAEVDAELVSSTNQPYYFVNLISRSKVANAAFGELEQQPGYSPGKSMAEDLIQELKEKTIPLLHDRILSGSYLRPVSIQGRQVSEVAAEQSLNTSYPAYKEGLHGPQNRALIMKIADSSEGLPVYAVAALYDHDDDGAINRALFLKRK